MERRNFLLHLLACPALLSPAMLSCAAVGLTKKPAGKSNSKLKVSLNAYSFNQPLREGSMTLFDLIDFCIKYDFDAVDLTGYYFPGYPLLPSDEYIHKLKRKVFLAGLEISGTGVRNDFTLADTGKRAADVMLIKKWIECAAKLGAPVIRIFSGNTEPAGYTREQVIEWMVKDIKECVKHGEEHGVIVAIQNHNDFIKTGEEVKVIMDLVSSEWFGLVLDIGSYRTGDPFEQIKNTARYAVNWQIKENMFVNGVEQKTDLEKVISIIVASGYRGYLPIETLGAGDPKIKVPEFLMQVKNALKDV